ncbi:MAG TPA: hypothetical protein VMV10_04710 [Pirellulales bacterium]|nr:hypothetical protein [Pirellulales bacterium]
MKSPPTDLADAGFGFPAGGKVVVLIHGLGANGFLLMGLHLRLAELDADPAVTRIHLVSHSMGGIVARYALILGRPTKLGRFVMLAPPNKGSRLASFCGPALRCCFPAIDQLAARPGSFVNGLPEPEGVEVGIIDASIDLLVRAGNTSLACQRDHIVLTATHTLLAFQGRLAEEVLRFLATGRFSSAAAHRS